MGELGAIFYRGPSLLTGDPIVGVLTGLQGGSSNPKTGPMAQAWILRSDIAPMDAKRRNLDDAVCGDCKLRGRDGRESGCYVAAWRGPFQVWSNLATYFDAVAWADLQAVVEGRSVRFGAYGDPAAIPFEVWRAMLDTAAGWVAYTHAWRTCDPRFRAIAMASVDTPAEYEDAQRAGWRTFRIRVRIDDVMRERSIEQTAAEFTCPASDEGGRRSTCQRCQLCRGHASPARNVAILAHGKPSSLRMFRVYEKE
jgi:hypothetical protein